jgi:hypothetical protein
MELFTSEALLDELRDVLARPKCTRRLLDAGLSADKLLNVYTSSVTLVEPAPVPRLAPDPDDDIVIGTAVAARAELLITGDKPLLSVGSFDGGRVVSVSEALDLAAARPQR